MITRFLIYGALGWLLEVVWTGLGALKNRDFKLSSNTSLWMFFIFGMVVILEPMFVSLANFNFILRGIVYAAMIFLGEFITGSLLKQADLCPWDYSASRYNVKGVIRWDYIPVWIVVGLFYERVFWWLV